MIEDPLLQQGSARPAATAERLAALRSPAKKRAKPAHTSKVLTAGISTTALFGMVAVMGWQSGTGSAQNNAATPTATQGVLPVPVVAVITTPTIIVSPQTVPATVAPLAPTVPVTVAETVPATVTPVIPVAVPAPQPKPRAASHTKTKSSG